MRRKIPKKTKKTQTTPRNLPIVIDILFRVISSGTVTVKIGKIAIFVTFYPGEGLNLSVRLTMVYRVGRFANYSLQFSLKNGTIHGLLLSNT